MGLIKNPCYFCFRNFIHMKKFKQIIILSFLLISFSNATEAQRLLPPQKPKLVVCLVIEGLQPDYLERFEANFSEGGFNRLKDQGKYYSNAGYDYAVSMPGPNHASIVTGTTPRHHGITSKRWYDRYKKDLVSCHTDSKSFMIGGREAEKGVSARYLKASTIGDELKLSSYGNGKVVSVSLDSESAVLMAGHSADAVYWMDDESGKWISSDYYIDWLPEWVDAFNDKKFGEFYLNNRWELLLDEKKYQYDQKKRVYKDYSLPIDLTKYKSNKYSYGILKQTPFGNMLLKDFAVEAIKNETLGNDDVTDILFINFKGSPALENEHFGPFNIEMEDFYIRLDQEIDKLIASIEETIGRHNVLTVLTGTQSTSIKPEYLENYNIPSGYFKHERSLALLNTYLMAIYGQGKWIEKYHAGQVYLNHELIENSKYDLIEMQNKTSEFLSEFTGVSAAIPAWVLNNRQYESGLFHKIQESYHPGRSGDVMITLAPGWVEENGKQEIVSGNLNQRIPICFYGWKVGRGTSTKAISIEDIAPTLSFLMGIPLPNASTGLPIEELF